MNFSDAHTLLGPLCALGSSLTWAIGSSVYTHQAGRVGAMEVNFSRAAIATPLFIVAAIVTGGLNSFSALQPSNLGWLSLSVVCSYGIGDMMFYMAALRLGTPTALAIGSIYPVWATLFGALTLGEQVGAQRRYRLVEPVPFARLFEPLLQQHRDQGVRSGGQRLLEAVPDRVGGGRASGQSDRGSEGGGGQGGGAAGAGSAGHGVLSTV